jgi:hypothetical protein
MQNEYDTEILSVTAPTLKEALDVLANSIGTEIKQYLAQGKCRIMIKGVNPHTDNWIITLNGYLPLAQFISRDKKS